MIARLAAVFVLVAVPAAAQAPVYTNKDLGKIERTHRVTEEELASLRAHQFVYTPPLPRGPQIIRVNSSTFEGPFGPFYMPPREPLDPFFYTYGALDYGYGGYWGNSVRGPVTVTVPNLSYPAPITVPDFARGPYIPPSLTVPAHHGRRR